MGKKGLIIICAVALPVIVFFALIFGGIIPSPFKTLEGEQAEGAEEIISIDDLQNNCYYVWHNDKQPDIKNDLRGTTQKGVFKLCPAGLTNWKDNGNIRHTIWFDTRNDSDIPTLYAGDGLIYISGTNVPYEGIEWERFADYGYTIGAANLEGDQSGHYRIINSAEDGYAGYINPGSDAAQLMEFANASELFIDKIGSVRVRDDFVSDGGTLLGLDKDTKYVCEWYMGTYYQDFEMAADTHAFCHLEKFTTYQYEFLHSNCISITIPEWLKTGYYYVSGLGFFRYVSKDDIYKYNGKAYDAGIDWNDPMILYDENGSLEYDPSTGFELDVYKERKYGRKEGSQTASATDAGEDEVENNQPVYVQDESGDYPEETENVSDSGAEMYE